MIEVIFNKWLVVYTLKLVLIACFARVTVSVVFSITFLSFSSAICMTDYVILITAYKVPF